MSVARRTESVIAVTDGMKLPGKMKRWMKSTDFERLLVELVLDRDGLQQHGAVRLQQLRALRRSRCRGNCAPTASIISIETSLS